MKHSSFPTLVLGIFTGLFLGVCCSLFLVHLSLFWISIGIGISGSLGLLGLAYYSVAGGYPISQQRIDDTLSNLP